MSSSLNFALFFNLLCLLACTLAISYCIITYLKDEDTTSMEFDPFDPKEEDRGYPSFSLCLLDPILETKLDLGVNKTRYRHFLGGFHWDQQMTKIDYDKVTVDLNEHILLHEEMDDKFNTKVYKSPQKTFPITTKNLGHSDVHWAEKKKQNYHKKDLKPFFVNHRCIWGKCFGQDLPYDSSAGISKYTIWLNMNAFTNGQLPPGKGEQDVWNLNNIVSGQNAFGMIFHLPNQMTRSIRHQYAEWDFGPTNASEYRYHTIQFNIRNMQVLKRRNKRKFPCSEGLPNDDEKFYQMAMNSVDCRPSFMNSSIPLDICSTKEQMLEYNRIITKRMLYGGAGDKFTLRPCLSLQSLEYTFDYARHTEDDIKDMYESEPQVRDMLLNVSSALKLELNLRLKSFQLIENVRKYNPESLIGNAGKDKKYLNWY